MALATAIATAPMRAALAVVGVLALSAPALASEQVFIWRDPSGVVRFSPIEQPEPSAAAAADQSTMSRGLEIQPAVAICDARPR